MKAKKLIEVAMPIKEISAESVRDNRLTDGHIKTIHMWWARRPLPTCRAVVFASLVPDPLDPNCPQAFKDAVEDILCTGIAKNIYAPYPDIPYTAIFDPMDDNLRNRLLMFIGKFSEKCQANMIAGKSTPPKEQLQDGCLIKWESKNDETVLNRARKLIWVAYNSQQNPDLTYAQLSKEFDEAWSAIKEAESKLYSTTNRHISSPEVEKLEADVKNAIDAFQSRMPSVFDPFAGGGAIPLEAARLGCRSFGNDINPVAHIIEKGSVEFPQKYGKPITYSRDEFMKLYGEDGLKLLQDRGLEFMADEVTIPNRLSFDVEYFAKLLIEQVKQHSGYNYPVGNNGLTPIAYYWARTAKCTNPSCGALVPMLRQFYLANTKTKKVFLYPLIDNNNISFTIKEGDYNEHILPGWNKKGTVICPCCKNVIDSNSVKLQSKTNGLRSIPLAIIWNGINGKTYSIPTDDEFLFLTKDIETEYFPNESMERNSGGGDTFSWGITKWGDLFSKRQLSMLNTFVKKLNNLKKDIIESEYSKALITYLSILLDRIILYNTTFGVYETTSEKVNRMFGRQAISMSFVYPESNPFCGIAGSAINQLDLLLKVIDSESTFQFTSEVFNASSGEKEQFAKKSIDTVVTDPPYYNAIAYADISDFFYIWLKRCLYDLYPLNFSTPKTPKAEECTALKHHHNGNESEAKKHFEDKLTQILTAIEYQTNSNIVIMFAHQSTEAWTTLCNSILSSNMNIKGSWAMDTELATGMKTNLSTLESSVTVACTPSERKGYGSYKKVKQAIQRKVEEEVKNLYDLGFRGADLLTACFGKAVSEFGNYEHVEKADGSEVTVAELLDMARTAAFTALIRDFASDDYTKFYIGWLQLNGMGETDYDDATKFTRAGMNVNIGDIFAHDILVKNETGNTQHLGTYKERVKHTLSIPSEDAPLIDKVHYAMYYWKEEDRGQLLQLIAAYGQDINNEFWRVFTVLKELLPEGDDREQVVALLNNAETLIKASKSGTVKAVQGTFDFGE